MIRTVAYSLLLALAGTGPAMAFMDLYKSPETVVTKVSLGLTAPGREAGRSRLPPLSAEVLPQSIGDDLVAALGGDLPSMSEASSGYAPRPDEALCISAIRTAEDRYGIPDNLLMAIGLQEAGRNVDGALTIWPWSVNSHGASRVFDSKSEAAAFVRSERKRGRTLIDTGCMQVNRYWHPDAFADLEESFDPVASASYAAEFLSNLHAESGDWMVAAGNYHSRTPKHHRRYLQGIRKNLKIAAALPDAREIPSDSLAIPQVYAKNDIANTNATGQDQLALLVKERGFSRKMDRLEPPRQAASPPGTSRDVASPPKGAWWSTGGSARDAARSIYSSAELEPVAPQLSRDTPGRGD